MQGPVFLTGMMGSGKSTVGRLLADRCGAELVDLDTRIERLLGRSVVALLAEGEESFRESERQALRSLVEEPGLSGRAVIVATGGGAVLDPDSRALMRRVGTVVHLRASASTLSQRLLAEERAHPGARPLLRGEAGLPERIAELLAARSEAYADCDIAIDADADAPSVRDAVLAALHPNEAQP